MDLTARFVGKEENLTEQGYEAAESELGKVYYRPNDVKIGIEPEMDLMKFLWAQRILMKGITPA